MIEAKIIADSLNPKGIRITTFVCKFPRIILAEINTHRAFSRNSASSRAIPFEKMLKMVKEDPFIPIAWMKDHKGMQGNEFFDETKEFVDSWLGARDGAIIEAKHLSELGLTKQIVNRLLEPFMWHTAIITATDFENFFHLRCNPAAEIHLQDLANKMKYEMSITEPKMLKDQEWHIPFGDRIDLLDPFFKGKSKEEIVAYSIYIAIARCARVSYMTFDGVIDYEKDIKLHDQLSSSGHWSPFEHCAKAENNSDYSGNFRGFTQYRKLFLNENII